MPIKIKHRQPRSTDLKKDDIIINVKEGALYYKSDFGLHRLVTAVQPIYGGPTPYQVDYSHITGTPTIPPDYGDHPDYTGVYAEVGHTHAPDPIPAMTNYFYKHFAMDLQSAGEQGIPWASDFEQANSQERTKLMFPHGGTLNRIYWKSVGTCASLTIKLYKNISGENASFTSPIQTFSSMIINAGDGSNYGAMNTIIFDETITAGDHFDITFKPEDGNLVDETIGQLLFTADITT